jgi:hypothetical protein
MTVGVGSVFNARLALRWLCGRAKADVGERAPRLVVDDEDPRVLFVSGKACVAVKQPPPGSGFDRKHRSMRRRAYEVLGWETRRELHVGFTSVLVDRLSMGGSKSGSRADR